MWTAKKKNNAKNFKTLLVKLTLWLKNPVRTVYILDNASCHRNPGIKAYLRGKGISVMYLPSSSSVLNPIVINPTPFFLTRPFQIPGAVLVHVQEAAGQDAGHLHP